MLAAEMPPRPPCYRDGNSSLQSAAAEFDAAPYPVASIGVRVGVERRGLNTCGVANVGKEISSVFHASTQHKDLA
jgi:hypothetical protein